MSDHSIDYRLPVSALRFSGTWTKTADTILETTAVLRSGTVELDVIGGYVSRTLKLHEGFLKDTKASFTVTDDGRLSDLDVTTTGQVGKVLLGVTAVAANIAGLFAGFPPGVLAAVEKKGDTGELTPEECVVKAYIAARKGNAESRDSPQPVRGARVGGRQADRGELAAVAEDAAGCRAGFDPESAADP